MDKEKLFFNVSEDISNILILLEKIDVMLEDVSFDLYEKINLDTSKHVIDLESVMRIVQIKHSIICEYTTQLRDMLKKLVEDFDAAYNCAKEES